MITGVKSPNRDCFVLVLILLVQLASPVLAQNNPRRGSMVGSVVDAITREALAGASVQIMGTNLGVQTDTTGRFKIESVPLGEYSVRASYVGYAALVKTDISAAAARPPEVEFALQPIPVEGRTITVTPEYFPRTTESQISVQSQSAEEIRRLPGGFEDVVRAVSILPGVGQAQPGRNDLIVRGGAPSENLYVIDDLEVPNINHFGTQGFAGGPLSFINLDFVRSTSFSSGGFGARYGDRLSSLLKLDLRDGRTDRLGGKATISSSQFGLNLEGPVRQRGSYILSARRSYLDFIFKAAGFSFVPEYWDFLGKTDYRLDRANSIRILGIGALDRTRFFNDTPDRRFDNSRVLGSNQNQAIGYASWEHLFKKGFATLTFGQTYTDFRYRQDDSLLNPVFRNNSSESETSLRGDLVLRPARRTTVSAGGQGRLGAINANLFAAPFVNSFGQDVAVDISRDTTAIKSSGYVQLTQGLSRLNLTGGMRFDYFNLIKDNFVASPRFSASYALTPTLNLNTAAGLYYQSPSYIWLLANPENGQLKFVGANQYIIGVDHVLWSDTRMSVEFYLKDYFDYPASTRQPYLVLANTGAGYGGRDEGFVSFGIDPLVSRGAGRSRGLEVLVQKKLSGIPCYGILAVSYGETRFRGVDGVMRPGSYDQRLIANLGGGYIFNEKWELSTKFRFATGSPYTPYNADGTQSPSAYNSVRLPANHSLDLRVDRRWNFAGWTMITYLDLQNVYNHKPHQVPRFNTRTHRVEENSGIGILPAIGISAEF
ncbi:MAG: TonB-dependent receptor [candidate division Zixibacteria bacterium]|nr:TonB-dependent receptor [candidate division Zixibacteria bacterium]